MVGDAVAGADLLDVDVDQLAGVTALVAIGWLGRLRAAELAQPDAQQDRRHRRERLANTTRSPRRSSATDAAARELHELVRRAMRDRPRPPEEGSNSPASLSAQ
jgi:hypothetical protein